MKTIKVKQPINLKVVKFELDFSQLIPEKVEGKKIPKRIKVPKVLINQIRKTEVPAPPLIKGDQKRNINDLVEELLDELYADQRWNGQNGDYSRGSTSAGSFASSQSIYDQSEILEISFLETLDYKELQTQEWEWRSRLQQAGEKLAKHVRVRDRLKRQQKRLCGAFSVLLRHITGVSGARFGVTPGGGEGPGEGGYAEWHQAMRLVARLPAGVPQHFRRKLWLTLAERHLTARGVEWPSAERACFRGTAQPDDTELGSQIIKDLHRTGCSLFCGTEGRENQAMLRRVLLAYARWNKDVGYCQGFNMIAAIILEVMDKSEPDSLKVMIYLVEAVLPEGYFADDLRGLSADMAAFRDLLRLRLPRLANHMDYLQKISDGGGVEPPLPDVFTMQWFLTLYATWLPRESLLRIWDLVLLDGNEILLLTALAIWDLLQDRILSARSADEFYSCMGGGVGAVWEAGDALVARVVAFGSVPELPKLRNLHRYRVAAPTPAPPSSQPPVYQPPLHSAMQSMTKRGLRLFYSEDEGDSSDDNNKMALATVIPRREDRIGAGDRLSLDIGALKRQYARLRERQRQAHVILAAACARHAAVGVPTSPTSLTVNNLLLGKSAIVSSRGRRLGPPPGAVPPSRQSRSHDNSNSKRLSTDTISWHEELSRKTLSRRDSLKWKDVKKDKPFEKVRKASIDFDETGDGIIVSDKEASEMIATLRSRSSSETSSYSSHADSSTDTSLCDENEKGSDSDGDLPELPVENKKVSVVSKNIPVSPILKETKIYSPVLKESKITNSPTREHKPVVYQNTAKDIADYLDTAAGIPLRTYIDEFDTKLRDTVIVSEPETINSPAKIASPLQHLEKHYRHRSNCDPHTVRSPSTLLNLDCHKVNRLSPLAKTPSHKFSITREDLVRSTPTCTDSRRIAGISPATPIGMRTVSHDTGISPNIFPHSVRMPKVTISPSYSPSSHSTTEILRRLNLSNRNDDLVTTVNLDKNLVFLSPVVLSPNNCNFMSNLRSPNKLPSTRTPDVIDSLTMYENFVPDIDLSEDNSPFARSPARSPGNDSIIVSEDEPPIPLKIDKYFEHSPEFFGARLTDPNNADIPNRRAAKRLSRLPKKPDSLTLQSRHNETILKEDTERASSLPQSHSFIKITSSEDELENSNVFSATKLRTPENTDASPKDYMIRSGRKNSERALQIIQENSKILSRILTKQNVPEPTISAKSDKIIDSKSIEMEKPKRTTLPSLVEKSADTKLIDSPVLKESTSDSLIGCRKRNVSDGTTENHDFVRIRPISVDDPFSLELRDLPKSVEFNKSVKSPNTDCLGNKTDTYGWENKGFLVDSSTDKIDRKDEINNLQPTDVLTSQNDFPTKLKATTTPDWTRRSLSGESKQSITLPSSEIKDTPTYGRQFTSDDCNYPLSNKYNDYVLSEASKICRKTINEESKENIPTKTDDSQASDFAHVVTSSISFTYEPSVDDSPTGAKSNSSDTLCQITSLDQVSTPISPKLFPLRDISTLSKDFVERSDKFKIDSDDTCSAITSLPETDNTLSSLSYPRSPSTGSYHPFPTRPMRLPKDIGVKLGMYPKDAINSSPK